MKRVVKILSMAIALAMCLAMAVPAAADFGGYTPVAGGTTSLNKYMVLDKDAPIPEMSFSFSLVPASGDDLDANVKAGLATATAAGVTLNSSSSKYTSGTEASSAPELAEVDWANDIVVYNSFNLDFTQVQFPAPGIYRYVLTEVQGSLGAMTYDDSRKYVDVYVINDTEEGSLKVQGYIVHDAEDSDFSYNTGSELGMAVTGKSEGFVNELETVDLTLSKVLTGNQANFSDTFQFTISVTLPDGASDVAYTIKKVVDTVSGDVTLTTESGSGTASVMLGHNAKIEIDGLPKGTKVTITETQNGSYSASYVVGQEASVTANATGEITMNSNTDVVFTNTLEGIIPTGVLLTIAPFAGLMLVGLVGVLVMMKKKNAA